MSNKTRCLANLAVPLVVIVVGASGRGLPQENTRITHDNPLAYIGPDDNVYITDALLGGVGTALTTDANHDYLIEYRVSSWSPNGQIFMYVQSYDAILYILKSGQPTEVMEGLLDAEPYTAWSPDGTQFAYFGSGPKVHFGVYSFPIAGGEPTLRGRDVAFSMGDGPGRGLPESLLAEEQGRNEFTEHHFLAWLPQGIFYGTYYGNSCAGAVIVQSDDTFLCSNRWSITPPFAISPDGSRIIGRTMDLPVPIELTFSEEATDPAIAPQDAGLPAGATPLAWGEDGLYYALRTDTRRVESEWENEFGYFEYTESTLTLWLSKLDGSPDTKIYETRGYGIGRVALPPTNDLPLVVSIVTSDVPAAEAFNNGATAEEIEALRSHVEMVALQVGVENTAPIWTLPGAQPLYGRGNFTVVRSAE